MIVRRLGPRRFVMVHRKKGHGVVGDGLAQ